MRKVHDSCGKGAHKPGPRGPGGTGRSLSYGGRLCLSITPGASFPNNSLLWNRTEKRDYQKHEGRRQRPSALDTGRRGMTTGRHWFPRLNGLCLWNGFETDLMSLEWPYLLYTDFCGMAIGRHRFLLNDERITLAF